MRAGSRGDIAIARHSSRRRSRRSPLHSLRILLPGSVANLAVQGLLLSCGLGTGMATARVLGPVQRGELSFLVLVPSTLTVLGSLGVEFGTYYLWHQEWGRLRGQLLAAGLLVTALSGTAGAAIGFAVVAWFEPRAGLFPALLVAASVPLSIANAILTMALMANRRMFAYNVSRLVGPVGYTIAIAACWELRSLGLIQAVSAWFGSVILTVVADVVMVTWMGASRPRWDRRTVQRTVSYGLRSYVGTVAQYGTLQLDQGLLVALAGNGALGLYYAAVSVGQVVLYLANNISSAMMGQFSNRSREQQWQLAAVAAAVTAAATAGIVSILFFLGGPLISVVLGAAYLPGLTALRILLPGLVFLAVTRVMNGYFIAVGRAHVFARAAVAGLTVTVVGDLIFIPKFQADGAALASTIAYGVMMIWLWLIFRTERGQKACKGRRRSMS
jgi:O-antigen/teichoic acid export membrane protein